jgi:putative ABC transport system permease protein
MAALLVVLLARKRGIHLEGEAVIAMVRGIVQIVAVGSILLLLLRAPRWTGVFLLASMIVAAGATSARRAKGMPDAFRVSTWSIACGAGSVIAVMAWLGVIDTGITSLVPVGSMLIANAMNTNGLALNRLRSEVLSHTGEIETALALGAEAKTSVAPYVQGAFEASLIPAIDSLRSLGIVWIPGLMAGMLLSGARPVYAAIYQFVVLAMIFAASGLTSLVSTMLIRARIFTSAQQLILQPGR